MRRWIQEQLQQGLTPGKLAWCVALGMVLGIFPMLGVTMLLCFAAASLGRLNHPAIQSVNYLVYPLQLLLLIPFYKAGAVLFHAAPAVWTLLEVRALLAAGVGQAAVLLWTTTWHAITVWALMAVPLTGLMVIGLTPLFRRMRAGMKSGTA